MTLKKRYDNIIVGSSPLMLIEAYFLSKCGNSILIIEKNKVAGGSWQTFSFSEISNQIEVGCHVWYRDKKCFDFLNKVFDLDIENQKIQPKVYKNGRYYPYFFINLFVSLESLLSVTSLHKMRQIKSSLISFIRDICTKGEFQYPLSGSYGFIQNILKKIENENIEIIYDTEIEKVDLSKKKIYLSDNNCIYFKSEIVASIKSEIKCILDSNSKIHNYEFEKSTVYNLYLILDKQDEQVISYVGVWGDDVIYRVSDMTYTDASLIKLNKRILCVQVYEEFYNNEQEKELIIIDKLIKMNIINSKKDIWDYVWKPFQYNNKSNDETPKLNEQFSPYMRYLNSHNLIMSFKENYKRWSATVNLK